MERQILKGQKLKRQQFFKIMRAAGARHHYVHKYRDLKLLYKRLIVDINFINKKKIRKVLDFGCGVGGSVVLGKLQGLEIVGIDIDRRNKVLKNLASSGYPIQVFNTRKFPWKQFEDNEFDGILSYNAINDRSIKFRKSLIQELSRITNRRGIWIIGNLQRYYIALRFLNKNNPKKIVLVKWKGRHFRKYSRRVSR